MIIEVSFCFDHLPTRTLETILRNDFLQDGSPILSDDALIHICTILAKRKGSDTSNKDRYLKAKWDQLLDSL